MPTKKIKHNLRRTCILKHNGIFKVVQKAPHSIPITQEELDKLVSISPSTILLSDSISEIRKAFQAIVGVGRSKLDTKKRVCGVYVFTNLVTGVGAARN